MTAVHAAASSTHEQTDSDCVTWVAVRTFVTLERTSKGKRERERVTDSMSQHYVYTLQQKVELYPVSHIMRHVHMYHRCVVDAGKAGRCRIMRNDQRGNHWVHWSAISAQRGGQQQQHAQYLFNTHYRKGDELDGIYAHMAD